MPHRAKQSWQEIQIDGMLIEPNQAYCIAIAAWGSQMEVSFDTDYGLQWFRAEASALSYEKRRHLYNKISRWEYMAENGPQVGLTPKVRPQGNITVVL